MERGVYFDAWYPRQHNYHPSLPPRRLKMVEDLEAYRATMLVWSALGGGMLSLPYLEEEAYGPVPPRYRMYGHLTDAEFIEECGKRGIKVFGIVFEHGWEFPVELNDDESEVLAWNEVRTPSAEPGTRTYLGMREFWQNRYPRLWKPREDYFPEKVLNAWGEPVEDILEECAQRTITGEPCHALWVECPDREHFNHMMDRNNPVWREYLKAVVRIQVDAGVQGVQFDETEVPLTSLQYGGCFCRTCVTGFRDYLRALPSEELPADVAGEDLSSFHYGEWLLARGFDFMTDRASTPLFPQYIAFQQRNIARYFEELATYTREYARSTGREVLISGNFFNLFEHYYPMAPHVDVITTEMRNTLWRQPEWYRYAAGFGRGTSVVVVENPYGGVVPELVEMLKRGRGYDRFRQSLYEAAALGVNMSAPYGSWMGSVVEDAFYAPHDLVLEIQTFLAEHERLFGTDPSPAEVGVVYGIRSNSLARSAVELPADNRVNALAEGDVLAFDQVCRVLAAAMQPYDVLFFPEGELRRDSLEPDDLVRYRTIVVPAVDALTERQAELLETYVEAGGRLIVLGELGTNLGGRMDALLSRDGVTRAEPFAFALEHLPLGRQVEVVEGRTDAALALHEVDGGVALHLIRYDYDAEADRVPPLDTLTLDLRLPSSFGSIDAFDPEGRLHADLAREGDRHRVTLSDAGVYAVALLSR
jgi:hypothetical protein